jgi:hypothetical protein
MPKTFPTTRTHGSTLPRKRATYETSSYVHGYDSYEDTYWVWTMTGDLLTSLLPDGSHAPVLDIDRPVSATRATGEHGSVLTVPGLTLWQAAKVASRMVAAGFCEPVAADLAADLRGRRWRTPFTRTTLVLPLTLDFLVLPSTSAGHSHVLVENVMSHARMTDLVKALRGPVVDRGWAAANDDERGLVVRRPLPQHPRA